MSDKNERMGRIPDYASNLTISAEEFSKFFKEKVRFGGIMRKLMDKRNNRSSLIADEDIT